MNALIETTDLVTNFYTYEGVVKALNRVSLVVDRGMTYGLVGESGCGKSVAVRSMMRIVQEPGRIEGGQVVLFADEAAAAGIDLLTLPETRMRALRGDQISMIFQEPNAALNPIMSIGDQVAESFLFHQQKQLARAVLDRLDQASGQGARGPLRRLFARASRNPNDPLLRFLNRLPLWRCWQNQLKAEALARSIDIIGRLGISNPEEIVHRYPHNLSGGMKQRIVIAMALACNPILLIADEATSNLDVTIQAQILELLKMLKQETISSILLITHDLGVVAETCDRVGVMYAGNLCEHADVNDLFRQPKHPYTQALLNSVPRLSQHGPLQSIDGAVPNLVEPPAGCRFHPRCPLAKAPCRRHFPEMREVGANHFVACFEYTDQPRQAASAGRG